MSDHQNPSSSPSLFFLRLGPMFSGKTTSLIDDYHRIRKEFPQLKILAIKPAMDNRYAQSEIVSHDGQKIPALSVQMMTDLSNEDWNGWDVLLVDEAQFISDIAEFVKCILSSTNGKQIYISGLNGDAYGCKWLSISELLPFVNGSIEFFKAKCEKCGKPAVHSARYSNGNKVEIGGADKFFPACTTCFFLNLSALQALHP